MRVARLFLFADWPEKYFSGQSEGGISNASGTRSVRVSAQGLSRSCCKLSPMKIPSSRLAAPGSPRMEGTAQHFKFHHIAEQNVIGSACIACLSFAFTVFWSNLTVSKFFVGTWTRSKMYLGFNNIIFLLLSL